MRGMCETQAGVTLIEMLLVMAIITVVAGLALPTVVSNLADLQMQGAVEQVSAACRRARFEATGSGRPHRVSFNTQRGTYWITREVDPLDAPGIFERIEESWGDTLELPSRIVFQEVDVNRPDDIAVRDDQGADAVIDFRPDGGTSGALITLAYAEDEGRDGTVHINLDPATGRIEVVSEEERDFIETERAEETQGYR